MPRCIWDSNDVDLINDRACGPGTKLRRLENDPVAGREPLHIVPDLDHLCDTFISRDEDSRMTRSRLEGVGALDDVEIGGVDGSAEESERDGGLGWSWENWEGLDGENVEGIAVLAEDDSTMCDGADANGEKLQGPTRTGEKVHAAPGSDSGSALPDLEMPSSSRGTASSGDRDQPLRESGSAGTSSESDVDTPTNVSSSAAHSPGSLSSSSLLQASTSAAAPPRLTRAFSMPLPSQLGLLQNPHSAALATTPPPPLSEPHSALHSFSIELAEAFQMVIQTLVQVSPPHLLDPAKEQLAACFLSLPTTSMSSLLISMKNLNYLAANTLPLTAQDFKFSPHINDFDIGEMLQGVGDAVSGVAANTGVDLVLYHGDVGMKHAYVRGDECGISCTLSHVSLVLDSYVD